VTAEFDLDFRKLNSGREPYPYQEKVAAALWSRRNVVLRAPTGSGKTLAVLAPFLLDRHKIGARRLIYALPCSDTPRPAQITQVTVWPWPVAICRRATV
jgi:Rad3-related DNA helicase